MYNIKALRGTMFCPQINYTQNFVSELNELLQGYVPVLIVQDTGNFVPTIPTWRLSSSDEDEVILFNADKIDIILKIDAPIEDVSIVSFANHCKLVFEKILSIKGYVSTRLALAPTLVVAENGIRPDSLYKRLFAIQEFQHSCPEISNVSQVFRVNKLICGNDVKVNFVANFHLANGILFINGNNQIRESYLCDFDINTMANQGYKFGIDEMKNFFDISVENFKSFYNLYFSK